MDSEFSLQPESLSMFRLPAVEIKRRVWNGKDGIAVMEQAEKLREGIGKILTRANGTWGVVVRECGREVCFEHLPDLPFIAESVIKVPIMAAVYAACAQGHLSLDERIPLRREDQVGGSGVLSALAPGLRLTVRDLVTLMIIQSDNTATNMLIDRVGKERIERTMRELGMERSKYSRKLMIYPADVAENNMITARDVARMLNRLAEGSFLTPRACEEMVGILKKQQYLNGLPSLLPRVPSPNGKEEQATDWAMACKSGWDAGRRHDAGILYTQGRCFVIAALSQDVEDLEAQEMLGLLGREVYEFARASEK
jgi:beta-lactamase class A